MAQSPGENLFFDDAPKADPELDKLGHAIFAERLVRALTSLSAPHGYVIGLHGPWGSGKSTILNFVERGLKVATDDGDQGPLVVRFEPWIISGHQDLTGAFMKLLAEQLPATLGTQTKRLGKGALRAIRGGADDVIDAIAKVGVIADAIGGGVTTFAGSVGKKAIASAASKWLEEPSLQASYNTLVKRLKEIDKRIVVIVDDIERLTSDEIRDLMTMVKTLGKLPNVIYLLSYDRSVVWGALKTIDPDPRSGAFAEKIVQHEVELPPPSRAALLSMLSEALYFLDLDDEPSDRRYALTRAGVSRWIRQPRDVVRLANCLSFAWAALAGEIDPDDLVCMEGLRLNDRALFEWIRDNRETLIENTMPSSDEEKSILAAGFAHQSIGARADAVALMVKLFPNRSDIFKQKKFAMAGETWHSVRVRRGIATAPGYDAYFSLNPGAMALPKRLIDDAVASFDDHERLGAIFRSALDGRDEMGNTLVAEMLTELSSRLDHGAKATPDLLLVLLRLADEIATAPWNGDLLTPRMHRHFLMSDILKQWSHDDRVRHLTALYASDPPLAALSALHVDLARSNGALPRIDNDLTNLVTPDELNELGAIVMSRIENARAEGTLSDEPAYYDIARVWALHAGHEAPRAWLSDTARSGAAYLAKIAHGLLGYSRSSRGREYGMSERPDESLYDVDDLFHACTPLPDLSSLTLDEAARVKALARGVEAWRVRLASTTTDKASDENVSKED
ncbi:MAG: P-loop NTPase fold protein [Blastomonas sp.]